MASGGTFWFLSPNRDSSQSDWVFLVIGSGYGSMSNSLNVGIASAENVFAPAIYLKANVLIESGNGTEDTPYILKLN